MGVHVVRQKETGESRRFAFVEYPTIELAQQFMFQSGGMAQIDGAYVEILYSNKNALQTTSMTKRDWICELCQFKNFERRDTCLRCNSDRPADERYVPQKYWYQGHRIFVFWTDTG